MIDNLINKIDSITDEFKNNFSGLSKEQLNRKPDEQTWSIAQNIEHLIIINESYFRVVEQLRNGNYKLPVFAKAGFIVNFWGKTLLKAVNPGRRKKLKTFSIWNPPESEIPADIPKKFIAHQSKLKKLIGDSEDLLRAGTVISSPAKRFIVYKLETAFDIIVTHEQRHLEQAKEVLTVLNESVRQ